MSSCGSSSPTTPSSSPRVSGAWIGHSTLTSVSGGECVGSTLAAAVGSRDIFSARIQQNESELAASLTYQGNRTSCVYRGSTANGALNLNFTSCPAGRIETFVCSNGDVRQLEIVGTRVTAQNSGTTRDGHRYDDLERVRAGKQLRRSACSPCRPSSVERPRHPSRRLSHLRRLDSARIRRWSRSSSRRSRTRSARSAGGSNGPRPSVPGPGQHRVEVVDCASAARRMIPPDEHPGGRRTAGRHRDQRVTRSLSSTTTASATSRPSRTRDCRKSPVAPTSRWPRPCTCERARTQSGCCGR